MSRRALSTFAPIAILSLALFSGAPASANPGVQAGDGQITAVQPPIVAAETPAIPASPEVALQKPIRLAPAVTLNAMIDLTNQRMTVSAGGNVLHVWPISSGARGFETPTGTFRPQWTARMHFSKKYDNAPMPHSVFFNGGIATHATQATGRLGSPASHGCIRLNAAAAATFYGLVHKHGLSSTRIVVQGSPRFRDEVARRRDTGPDVRRVANRQYIDPRAVQAYGYSYAPAYGYAAYPPGYAPAYGYAQPRRVYMQQRPIYRQVRYLPPGYARY